MCIIIWSPWPGVYLETSSTVVGKAAHEGNTHKVGIGVCVCVCVCVRAETDRQTEIEKGIGRVCVSMQLSCSVIYLWNTAICWIRQSLFHPQNLPVFKLLFKQR